jgi:DNA repair exonuclease SbcCD ATPase subunit
MDAIATMRGLLAASLLACLAAGVAAQDGEAFTTAEEVRAEIGEAMEAVTEYSAQERDQALAEAREALDRLDAVIERREQALRENWDEMSEEARETARAQMETLRDARNRLGERYGALQAGASSAWGELKEGFADAWGAFSDAWGSEGENASSD